MPQRDRKSRQAMEASNKSKPHGSGRISTILLAMLLALTCAIAAGGARPAYGETGANEYSPFSDTPTNAWYHDSVAFCKDAGLISGYKDGRFGPNDTLTRAQAATILWRYYEPDKAASYQASAAANTTKMPDVQPYEWYTGAANWAVANGVISGKADGDSRIFDPNGVITREQLSAIVCNASQSLGTGGEPINPIKFSFMPDASSVSTWATKSVAWSLTNGVISGKSVNGQRYIDPLGNVTRAEMAAILTNAIRRDLLIDPDNNTSAHTHSWTPVYTTIHHDAVYESQRVVRCYRCAECGFEGTHSEVEYHQDTTLHSGMAKIYGYDEVCVSDAYDEQVLDHYECSCGATK